MPLGGVARVMAPDFSNEDIFEGLSVNREEHHCPFSDDRLVDGWKNRASPGLSRSLSGRTISNMGDRERLCDLSTALIRNSSQRGLF